MELLIQLPDEIKALIAVLVTMLVTEALKYLGGKLGLDLSGYAAQVTAAVVGSILVLINALLVKVPAEFAPVVQSLFGLLVVVLGSFGAYKVFLSKK